MTDLRRSVDTSARYHQQQNCHDTYRSSCNSTPEPKPPLALCKSLSNGSGYRNPLLQALSDHPNMSSTSGGSSTSTTTATATTIGRSSQYISENGNHNSSMGEIQFDEREIYYVSPSKRKSSLSASQTPVLRSSLRACERLRSFSPTSAAAIAPAYPPIMPSAAYGARLSGTMGQDLSFDNYDASSHYSDTAMQVLRSGSCSAMTSILNTNNLMNNSATTVAGNDSSSNLLPQSHSQMLQQQQQQQQAQQQAQRSQNNVTFSNHITEQRALTPQNRGSLRRSKGRSNQSLCSCDAGSDAELNPDPARPLYEYSLERRRKVHTYTCEQNAQILLRLERERNRKFSLSGGSGGGGSRDDLESDALSSSDAETIPPVPPPPAMKRNGSLRSLRLLQHLQQQQQQQQQQSNPRSAIICNGKQASGHSSSSNNNNISSSNHSNNTASNNNNHISSSIATLCSGDLLNDCAAKSVHDARTVIDDCTTSILKCANGVSSDIMSTTSTTTNGSYKPQLAATLATMATTSHTKPDVCHVTNTSAPASAAAAAASASAAFNSSFGNYPPPYPVHDDITVPRSQKSDPSLCFLHKSSSGGISVGPKLFMGEGDGGYNATDFHLSQRDLQQKLQQYKNSSRLSLSKYNTIGPSSDYARQLAMYTQQQQQQQQLQPQLHQHDSQPQPYPWHQQTPYATMRPLGSGERCRCFSKSWSNFSRDDFMQPTLCANHDNQSMMMSHQQQIFHTANPAAGKGRTDSNSHHHQQQQPPPSLLRSSSSSYNSRSFNNLVDIDNYNYDTMTASSLHHHKLHATNSKACNGNAATTANNTIISNSSGLKDKLLHGHQHLHQHFPQHKEFHCDDHVSESHQHHHHALGSGSGHLIKSSSEKFHNSSNHHPPHHSSLTSIMPWKHRQSPSRGSSSSGTNSFRFDAAKHWLAVSSILLIIGAASVAVPLALRVAASAPFDERLRVALQLLDQVPLIDGHNDLPWNIRKFLHNKLNDFNFNEDLRDVSPWKRSHWSHTDLTRLKKGRVSAQFWAAYVPCEAQHRDAVQLTLEQIDVIKRLTDRYSPELTTCTSAQEIIEAHKNQQLCSLTGVEGGHSLGGSLAVLRTLYAIGVRYMTLTSTCHTPWADSSSADAPTFNVKHGGLTIFGKKFTKFLHLRHGKVKRFSPSHSTATNSTTTTQLTSTTTATTTPRTSPPERRTSPPVMSQADESPRASTSREAAAALNGNGNGNGTIVRGSASVNGGEPAEASAKSPHKQRRSKSSPRHGTVEAKQRKRSILSIPNTIKLSMLNSGLLSFEKIKLEARDENNSLSKIMPCNPIDTQEFLKLCELRRKFAVLYKLEFQTAAKVESNTCRSAMKKSNHGKNQNPKCIPYDYNRVVLKKVDDEADSDYVNASYVDSLLKPNAYIVTQGPVEDTVNAFWRLVWQENVTAIIMLTKTFDFAKVMCVQYWPPNREVHETYGDININIVKEEQLANFHIRTFRLYKVNEANRSEIIEERLILQFHYTEWYSHCCPFSNALLEFRRRIRLVVGSIIKDEDTRGPMLVHCGDGGGRSGVYVSIDANLELHEEEEAFNVYGYQKKLRKSRKGLVENVEQYKFIYDTLEEHLVCGKTWFPVSELSDRLKVKARRSSQTKLNDYQMEYDKICKQTPRFSIGDCAGGHRADNREKNRDVLCVPPDNFRPYLTSFQGNAFTDYINSVFVDGYTKPREYIVTEWPMKHTLGEFWSLVYDTECSAVVVLCQPPANSQTFPSFWPIKSKMEKYGPVFSVHYAAARSYTNIKQWEFKINKKIVSLTEMMAGVKAPTRTVQLFQLTCWPMGHKVPTSTNSLVYLMNMVELWRAKTDYGPVCVVSPDGRSRCGVYCAANACIEQVIQHGEVDVFQAVKTVRRNRPHLVENMTEYKYCYDLVLHYVLHFLNKND